MHLKLMGILLKQYANLNLPSCASQSTAEYTNAYQLVVQLPVLPSLSLSLFLTHSISLSHSNGATLSAPAAVECFAM